MIRSLLAMLFLGAAALTALAQHQGHGGHHPPGRSTVAPYAEFKDRPIKALSRQQIDDLLAGRGMGLALAAELNGYPGPMHVLEHEEALALTAVQKVRMENLMTQMRADAVRAGEAAVAAERALDRLFADGAASEEALREAVRTAAHAQSAVRLIHLRTHLMVKSELTPEQTAAYNRVRGYELK